MDKICQPNNVMFSVFEQWDDYGVIGFGCVFFHLQIQLSWYLA